MNTGPADPVQKLVETKAEHRPIVEAIASDAGMSPSTRKQLLLHLLAEEDEQLQAIAARSAGGPGEPARFVRGLTVGSLRPEALAADPLRLGSLRVPSPRPAPGAG